jgi:beta-lactam-binding protein with PASTA domain
MEVLEKEGDFCAKCGYDQRSKAKETYYLEPGVLLHGRYLVGKALGSGGFGITYLGYDEVMGKKIAIKEYFPIALARRAAGQSQISIYAGDQEVEFHDGMTKALEEARRLIEFQHEPEITQVYDFFEENNTAYIVMELLDGITLKDKLKRDGRMSVEEALPIIITVLHGLEKVHQKNIMHRDIAPDNIFLLKNGQVKLLDFGAARQVSTGHSKSYTVILKQGYAPVEQYQSGGDQGPWTDVYATAATFYRMITGKKPPTAWDRKMNDRLVPPSALNVKISKNIENAILNALQVRIEDRTKSAEEFEQALLSGSRVKRTASTEKETDLGKWPFWLKGVCAAAVAAAIGVGAFSVVYTVALPQASNAVKADGVLVPNLINLDRDTAEALAEVVSLKFEVAGTRPSDTIKRNCVLEQQDEDGNVLELGSRVKKNSVIRVILSSGNGKAVIPDVRYMTLEQAKEELGKIELGAINTVIEEDAWAPEGAVVDIEPAINTEVKLEDVITLHVAGASEAPTGQAAVPDVESMTVEAAYNILKDAGYYLMQEGTEYDAVHPAGTVIRQNPAAGMTDCGTVITVTLSCGAKQTVMLDVTGQDQQAAEQMLAAAGLHIGDITHEYSDTVEAGAVIRQTVLAGTLVDEGSSVDLVISDGIQPVSSSMRQETSSSSRRTDPTPIPPTTTEPPPPTSTSQPPEPETPQPATTSPQPW